MKRESCISILLFLCSLLAGAQTVRVGIIGLDTSHSVAFTSQINDPQYAGLKPCNVCGAPLR